MNKTKLNNLVVVTFLVTSVFYTSCKDKEIIKTESTKIYTNASSTTGEGAEKLMEFAPPTENPYTISNMQRALDTLSMQIKSKSDLKFFDIRTTHKYIKFKPQDSLQLWALNSDTTLILFDYPLDRKIAHAGTYYRDPSVPEGQPNFQWTAVPVDKKLPEGIPFEVLEELYIPEEDQKLVPYYNTLIDDYITELTDIALQITGNFDTTEMKEVAEEDIRYKWRRRSKWNPSGRIRLSDNVLNITSGLEGVKVRARRWFTMRSMLTNRNGEFWTPHQFRRDVNYSINWERADYNIRSGRHGQAYFNGPKIKGVWNLDIVSGISWHYGQVHRGAYDYYYNNSTGLRQPPTSGFLGSRIAIGMFDESDRADYRHWQRNWLGPEIRMYSKWESGANRTAQQQYRTTIHELAHASHFNMSHWHFRNTEPMVKESWAVGVAWSFERLRYRRPFDLQNLRLQNGEMLTNGKTFDVVNFGERKYTPIVIDLIDNINQRANNGGNRDFPLDLVTGYSIRNIEDALNRRRTMNAWRDELKNNLPAGMTSARVDALFSNYIQLQ